MITYITLLIRPTSELKPKVLAELRRPVEVPSAYIPNSQKATRTDVSALLRNAPSRARYKAHDDDGEPGIGRNPDADGDLFIFLKVYSYLRRGARGRRAQVEALRM